VYDAELPGPLYCDTSALLKLYVPEPGSEEFNAVVEAREDMMVSDLTVTELVSALSRRVRQGTVTRVLAQRVHDALMDRLDAAGYQRLDLTGAVHRRAEHLLMTLVQVPLRAGDALHVALALSAGARSLASFDSRLTTAARAVGLTTYPR
jgi:uncharacterized protein